MSNTAKVFQITLGILKPDVVCRPDILKEVEAIIRKSGLYMIKKKSVHLTTGEVEEFYKEHKGRFFHNRLVGYMASGPVQPVLLAGEDSIRRWRGLLGPTKVFRTRHEQPNSLRGRYGLTDTRNSAHGADSLESMEREARFFFPDFCTETWLKEHAACFIEGSVRYCEQSGLHLPDTTLVVPDTNVLIPDIARRE